jgi:arylsulfatase
MIPSKKNINLLASAVLLGVGVLQVSAQQDRFQPFQGKIGKTLADSKGFWPQNPKAPTGAPNVVWILLDDVGFGTSSAFGGLVNTPTFETLAKQGLSYTNFHTCAICGPTRASLLTGRNSHTVHMGGFGDLGMSAGFPAWDGRVPSEAGTIAEILRDNGYNTFVIGKWGLTPELERTDAGPFDRWPLGKGFEHFFGFLGNSTDQYKPDLIEENAHVKSDGRHLSEQLTDKAISYITRQKKAAPDKPFFLYYAPGATHGPLQVDAVWSDKYKGKFDEGWDVYREKVLDRQIRMGIVPSNAKLPPRDERLQAWKDLSNEQKMLYARFMEVYAGFLEYTDYEIGRLKNYLDQSGQLDNTVIFLMIGDNGANKGTLHGTIDKSFKSNSENLDYNIKNAHKIGTPNASNCNYPLAWAQAANTPFKYWKQDANSEGGTRNPLVVFYPKGIAEKGGIRNQYGHVIDILPTTMELLGIKQPEYIRGIKQDPIHGTSLYYSFNNAQEISRHTEQYYYIFGARSIYKDGWKAATNHRPDKIDWMLHPDSLIKVDPNRFENDKWELYNLNEDFNEINDLSDKYPEKLKELKALFDQMAEKYKLYPFMDWIDINTRGRANNKTAPAKK